jgi:hypothetical protein
MERRAWERALARAVSDRAFRARLLADPAAALEDYGLSAEDRPYVEELGPLPTLQQLAAKLLHLQATVWATYESSVHPSQQHPGISPDD